jgi:methylenetetrahydrofolate dehydrogenase (NADP+)/methenyltetrahydrofolate cyclohydrolase
MTNILDGKLVAENIVEDIKAEVVELSEKTGKVPGLTVLIVGEDAASQVYVSSKDKLAKKIGLNSEIKHLSENVSEDEIIEEIIKLNNDNDVNGVLVQLPLPKKFNTWRILNHLSPKKDVDAFLPQSIGNIILNSTDIYPCTPSGIIKILDYYNIDVEGKNAVVLGRSFIVGKPIAAMLTNKNATVTICHSKTKHIETYLKNADIIVAAIGIPGYVKGDMVKDGVMLIDVGINRLEDKEKVMDMCSEKQIKRYKKKGYAITGDIHKTALAKSSFYTPVPGGIGKMTVAVLMQNTVHLFKKQNKLS